MQEIVKYLIENKDVLLKVKEGTASLMGVDSEELKALLDVFLGEHIVPSVFYWK